MKLIKSLAAIFSGQNSKKKFLEAVQIEVCTSCNLDCMMCPLPEGGQGWSKKYMAWETFHQVKEIIPLAHHLHLQGWGEPLLHPRIMEMIELLKAGGARTGMTTNGTLLNRETANKLVELGLDTLCVSIAGAREETHNKIRRGSSLNRILGNVMTLNEIKKIKGKNTPIVTFSYILTRQNIEELPQAVAMTAAMGIKDMVVTNIDFVHNEQADREKVFACGENRERYQAVLTHAHKVAQSLKLKLRTYPLVLEKVPVCEANPHQILFITLEGEICPCTYLSRPENPRIFNGKKLKVLRKSFGNIHEATFADIWQKPEYTAFREPFLKRLAIVRGIKLMAVGVGADKYKVLQDYERLRTEMERIDLPAECQTCYKAYGI